MSYGYKPTGKAKLDEKLAEALSKELGLPREISDGDSPYISLHGSPSGGVGIRKMTNLDPVEFGEMIRKADAIYQRIVSLA